MAFLFPFPLSSLLSGERVGLACEVHILLATQWRYSSLAGSDLGIGANKAVITSPVIFISHLCFHVRLGGIKQHELLERKSRIKSEEYKTSSGFPAGYNLHQHSGRIMCRGTVQC